MEILAPQGYWSELVYMQTNVPCFFWNTKLASYGKMRSLLLIFFSYNRT